MLLLELNGGQIDQEKNRYDELGARLKKHGLLLLINVPHERAKECTVLKHVQVHASSLAGLIHATRHATAVVGVDSGPLHLAAALKKPGAALFGPTDPAQTGPFRSPMIVVRREDAPTTYKRGQEIDPSMAEISVDEVLNALLGSLASEAPPASTAIRSS